MLPLAIAGGALAVDQASKWLVRASHDLPWTLMDGVRVAVSYNRGVSFGRLSSAGGVVVVLVAAVVGFATAAFLFAPWRFKPAIGLVLGGAVGNLVDRLRFDGAVLDFIDVGRWPTFNLADVFIVAGTCWVVLELLRGRTT